ncbi:hypothetical protein HanPI659440_Chr01g0011591 [Helianthus annuus]|nr:hypothetical protein HanPI659440_Chr01g0011591 [Helianthus annuus]
MHMRVKWYFSLSILSIPPFITLTNSLTNSTIEWELVVINIFTFSTVYFL